MMSQFFEKLPPDENWWDNCIAIAGSQRGFVSFGTERRKENFWSMREILSSLLRDDSVVVAEASITRRDYREWLGHKSVGETYHVPFLVQRARAVVGAPIWSWIFGLILVWFQNMWTFFFVLRTKAQIRTLVPLSFHFFDTNYITNDEQSLKDALLAGAKMEELIHLCYAVIPGGDDARDGPFCPIIFSDALSDAECLKVVDSHLDSPNTRRLVKEEIDHLWQSVLGCEPSGSSGHLGNRDMRGAQ